MSRGRVVIPASRALTKTIPWIPRRYALPGIAGIMFLINVGLIIAMLVLHAIHMDYYTYWNFTLITVFLGAFALTYPFQGWPPAILVMGMTPIVIGSTSLVTLIIWLVVAIDDRVYTSGTMADPDLTTKPTHTFSQIRTADWIVHGLPLLEILILHLFDLQIYFRGLLHEWEQSDQWWRRAWYWIWFYVSPLILLTIYMCFFDVRKKYTDELSLLAGVAIAVGLDLIVMTIYMLSLRMSETHPVKLPLFYYEYQLPPNTSD